MGKNWSEHILKGFLLSAVSAIVGYLGGEAVYVIGTAAGVTGISALPAVFTLGAAAVGLFSGIDASIKEG